MCGLTSVSIFIYELGMEENTELKNKRSKAKQNNKKLDTDPARAAHNLPQQSRLEGKTCLASTGRK